MSILKTDQFEYEGEEYFAIETGNSNVNEWIATTHPMEIRP